MDAVVNFNLAVHVLNNENNGNQLPWLPAFIFLFFLKDVFPIEYFNVIQDLDLAIDICFVFIHFSLVSVVSINVNELFILVISGFILIVHELFQ
jgi:hypothetical protein